MVTVHPYLNFDGNTEEAFLFYKSVFGGEFITLQRFKDVGDSSRIPADVQEKIMHIALPIGQGTILMGTDSLESMGHKLTPGNNFHLSLNTESREEADQIYASLSAGGQANMPMAKTFWGSYFGMLTDPFGVQWMVSYEEETQAKTGQTAETQFAQH
ncbi:VOC family protein [Rufibacter latericius]|uniref:VOC family protein n=1 Tax=Rufibacter latericius TaxID=2487040 RepID=A0A3M9MTY5_9BACT|nr:VOC family protein [Rufibacter latericius]RNI28981.1 VOC family protein [Rufibacter latericius]